MTADQERMIKAAHDAQDAHRQMLDLAALPVESAVHDSM